MATPCQRPFATLYEATVSPSLIPDLAVFLEFSATMRLDIDRHPWQHRVSGRLDTQAAFKELLNNLTRLTTSPSLGRCPTTSGRARCEAQDGRRHSVPSPCFVARRGCATLDLLQDAYPR
eukprot:TRINITY_DN2518_c0_g1_i4.p1 TRINITY_DN2518_c0_g1~~TRINITY_DN2518_c0_g1_i4.p1  ORF type:complete len:120 (+),score=0.81 TRINITY_DN2518_c0_g1_i4:230-589(+)